MGQQPGNGGGRDNPHDILSVLEPGLRATIEAAERGEAETQDDLSSTVQKRKKFPVSSVVIRSSLALLLSFILVGGWVVNARREKPPLGPPVPADLEGMQETLATLEKTAERVRTKWNEMSESVQTAFRTFYSQGDLQLALDASQSSSDTIGFLAERYVKKIKYTPLPEEEESKDEKEDYALCNMVVTATLRAVEIRLDQLAKLEKFAAEHPGTPEMLVERLTNMVSIQKIIESSDQKVSEIFQELLGFVERAKFWRSTSEKKRVENLTMPALEIPFPFTRLAEAVNSSVEREELRSLSPAKILGWQEQWNVPGLQGIIYHIKGAIEGSCSLQQKERASALAGWAQDKAVRLRLMHPFTIAVSLL
ncbi:uncharacterized protein EMH_0020940 [Eimeria mitis]|uniref:Uncharacterized protein n=1 Tax=Eimeria mitis TaxID=44415 RepID=U6KCN7_9EIME|nr:uncharacterized protein EMH_0020940 [Eimeria mitis]CDJ34551.1 hypothetical protein, conserved [Eimeria mitis]